MEKYVTTVKSSIKAWTEQVWQRITGKARWLFQRSHWVVVYGYAFLYMFTGHNKLVNMETFVKGNKHIPVLGQYAEFIGWGIPLLEILLAIVLVYPWRKMQRWALWTSTLLMGIFTLYIALMLLFAEKRLCHCGGVIEEMGWHTHLIFNAVWVGLGMWAIQRLKNYTI
jgi:hypothetical protein